MGRIGLRAANGLLPAAVVSTAALRTRALSRGGAVAATVLGGAIFAGTGIRGSVTLVAFFLSSTLLGRLPTPRALVQRRGNERDAVQVIANGSVAAALALASSSVGRQQVHLVCVAGFGGAVATATADTWATEIGSRSQTLARSILSLRIVAPGTSGAITLAGLTASAAGAALIAGLASARFGVTPRQNRTRAFPIALGGFTGALADSVLGATLQEVRFCDACARETEQLTHDCGARTRSIRGASWCNNDTVNLIATAVGAVTAAVIQLAGKNRASRTNG